MSLWLFDDNTIAATVGSITTRRAIRTSPGITGKFASRNPTAGGYSPWSASPSVPRPAFLPSLTPSAGKPARAAHPS